MQLAGTGDEEFAAVEDWDMMLWSRGLLPTLTEAAAAGSGAGASDGLDNVSTRIVPGFGEPGAELRRCASLRIILTRSTDSGVASLLNLTCDFTRIRCLRSFSRAR